MKLAFSTLGCPDWELEQIAKTALALGYEGIELRALGGSLDLLSHPELQANKVSRTLSRLNDQGLVVCCVDTSCRFDSQDADELSEQIEIAVRHGELAAALNAPLIRVFPDKIPAGATREKTRDQIASCLKEIAKRLPESVNLGLETHGDFARGKYAAEIVRLADHPKISLIWDIANAVASGDEMLESAKEVSPFLAHVHLRDAKHVEGKEHWLPVLAGRGSVSFAEAVKAVRSIGYDGFICFEWEKYWHRELEEPETAFADFAQAMKENLQVKVTESGLKKIEK
jgi:sugar phosphate isomerase/epimerase